MDKDQAKTVEMMLLLQLDQAMARISEHRQELQAYVFSPPGEESSEKLSNGKLEFTVKLCVLLVLNDLRKIESPCTGVD